MKEVKIKGNKLGTISLIWGFLSLIYIIIYVVTVERTPNHFFVEFPNIFIVIISLFINLLGIIMAFISLFRKVNKKTISFLGMVVNLINPVFIFLSIAISAK